MDGENNGNPYEQMDDLGVPLFSETPRWCNPGVPTVFFLPETNSLIAPEYRRPEPMNEFSSLLGCGWGAASGRCEVVVLGSVYIHS